MDKTALYPLLFKDNLHQKVWGGRRINPFKGLTADNEPIGESWEVSAVKGCSSIVANGPFEGISLDELALKYGKDLLGEYAFARGNGEFPVLLKFIDAAENLSIQVHPDDRLAQLRHSCSGKNEMWYIMDAAPDSFLYLGFDKETSAEEYERRVADGTICDILHRQPVKAGDVVYIPAGRVHAICGGIMLAEIQQSSDITYRIFDYNRPGLDGKPRELHTELAKEAISFETIADARIPYTPLTGKPVTLVDCPSFHTELLNLDSPYDCCFDCGLSFHIYMCIDGSIGIVANGSMTNLHQGHSCLIPASISQFTLHPTTKTATLLDVSLTHLCFDM